MIMIDELEFSDSNTAGDSLLAPVRETNGEACTVLVLVCFYLVGDAYEYDTIIMVAVHASTHNSSSIRDTVHYHIFYHIHILL
jgi:hypothetical protein